MSFSFTPRVFSFLCLAASVAGQWSGNYNITDVSDKLVPPKKCWIDGLAKEPYTAYSPCTCTGGEVLPDCNWRIEDDGDLFNRVKNAKCKCSGKGMVNWEIESLEKYGRDQPAAVRWCGCDPPASEGPNSPDGLAVPSGDCWCPADFLKEKSGLSEAKESPAVPETPPSTESIQKCRNHITSQFIREKGCDVFMRRKEETLKSWQRFLPDCSVASLTEVCKEFPQN